MRDSGIRAELDDSNETLGKRIRNAKTEKVPYTLVVGDEEIEEQSVTAEGRAGRIGKMPLQSFIARVKEEIRTRALG